MAARLAFEKAKVVPQYRPALPGNVRLVSPQPEQRSLVSLEQSLKPRRRARDPQTGDTIHPSGSGDETSKARLLGDHAACQLGKRQTASSSK